MLVNSDDGHKVWEPVLKAALEQLAGIPSPERRVITLSDSDLGRFDGIYAIEERHEVEVRASDGGLGVTLRRVRDGQNEVKQRWRCAPLSATEFRVVGDDTDDTVIEMLPSPAGEARAIRLWGRLGALVLA